MIERKNSEAKDRDGSLHCQYCQKPMSEFDYETYHGLCGKCREIVDWKQILKHVKNKE
jgi:hypothetical protein